mgnify:CR=1 FL=1
MRPDRLDHWEIDVKAIATEAGAAILEVYEQDFDVVSKADDSPLTQADLAHEAGVSKRTVERIEAGASAQMASLIRIFRVLDLMPALDRFIGWDAHALGAVHGLAVGPGGGEAAGPAGMVGGRHRLRRGDHRPGRRRGAVGAGRLVARILVVMAGGAVVGHVDVTGVIEGDRVQVTKGLEIGDHLIVKGHTEVEDGIKVMVQ